MGVDFLKRKQKQFAKGWDPDRLAAAKRLLAGEDALRAHDVVARTIGPNTLHEGDSVLVRADGDSVSVIVDLTPVAVSIGPTAAIVKAVRDSGGYSYGTIQASYPSLELVRVHLE